MYVAIVKAIRDNGSYEFCALGKNGQIQIFETPVEIPRLNVVLWLKIMVEIEKFMPKFINTLKVFERREEVVNKNSGQIERVLKKEHKSLRYKGQGEDVSMIIIDPKKFKWEFGKDLNKEHKETL